MGHRFLPQDPLRLGPGKGFEIDYDYCKSCGLCVSECPSGAIRMEAEQN